MLGGMLFGDWLPPLYGSSVCPTPAGSVRCVPSRYSEAGHGAAMRWGAPAHEKLKGGRTMRSCALEGKCMPRLRYAGARRRQLETQAGREVPVVGDADAKELQSGGSGLSAGGHRAPPRSRRASPRRRRTRTLRPRTEDPPHLGTPPPVDGVSIVSV